MTDPNSQEHEPELTEPRADPCPSPADPEPTAPEEADPPEERLSPTDALAALITQEYLQATRQAARDQFNPPTSKPSTRPSATSSPFRRIPP